MKVVITKPRAAITERVSSHRRRCIAPLAMCAAIVIMAAACSKENGTPTGPSVAIDGPVATVDAEQSAAGQPRAIASAFPTNNVLPDVAVWRPTTTGAVPLIVFSHGYRGCNTQSAFLTSGLAAAGYLVVAPNHDDAVCGASVPSTTIFTSPTTWSDQSYKSRADDIHALLATLRADPVTWPIDWSRVGLVGHSLGGYTVLGLGGAWPSWRVSGISAVVAMAPYCEPFILSGGNLGGIGVPVMYQGGTRDPLISASITRTGGCLAKTASPAMYVEFTNATHMAWTVFGTAYHDLILRYTLGFVDKYVKRVPSVDPATQVAGVSKLLVK
jgi:pimeloyl-ACP methyl ester carboxylesterase